MTEQEVHQFDTLGAATINTPLTAQEIAAANDEIDRLLPFREGNFRDSLTCSYYEPALLDIIQHPFFEEAACQVLRADRVYFFQTAIVTAHPEPNKLFSFWQHVDIQYRLSDFQATPKNILCSFFLWLTNVNERRAPMMFRPGSHLLLAEMRERDPDWTDIVPRVAPVAMENLPILPYAEPIPIVAKAGQVSVLTTAAVHGASVNVDTEPRRNLVFTFTAENVTISLPPAEEDNKRAYHNALRHRLRPERRHLLPA